MTEGEEALDRKTLTRRARLGVIVLIARTVLLQLTVLGGNVYLARLLDPKDFGVFAIVQFALSFFALFGDAGLAAALVQKKGTPNERELSSVWWLQILFSLTVIAIVFVSAPVVIRLWPDVPRTGILLLRVLAFEILLTAVRVVPAILLERELKFTHLSVLDFISTVAFYLSAVWMARMGWGVSALLWSVIVQGVVAALTIFVMRPWRPQLVMDRVMLKPILRFGLAYQAKNVIAFVNGATTPIFAGAMLGGYALGINNWAQTTAFFPLRLVEIMGRVTFPLYSRLQDDKPAFASSLERSVQICAVSTLFFVALFLGVGRSLIHVVFTDKWMPALPILWVYALAISIGFLAPLISSALDAIGRPGLMFRLSVLWTALNWIVVLAVTYKYRTVLAFSIAYCVHVVVGNLAIVVVVRNLLPDARIWPKVRAAIVAATVVAVAARFFLEPWATTPITLIIAVLACLAVFVGIVGLLDPSAVRELLALIPKREKQPSVA